MSVEHRVSRQYGHPAQPEYCPDWDLLEVRADTDDEMDRYLKAAAEKFWDVWIRGHAEPDGRPAAVLYKPHGAKAPWTDPGPREIDRMALENRKKLKLG